MKHHGMLQSHALCGNSLITRAPHFTFVCYVCPSTGIGLYASSRYWISSADNFTPTPASIVDQIVELVVLVSGKRTNDVMEVSQTSSTHDGSANAYNAPVKQVRKDMQKLGRTFFSEDPCNRNLRHAHTHLCCYFFHSGLSNSE